MDEETKRALAGIDKLLSEVFGPGLSEVIERLKSLDQRVRAVEERLGIPAPVTPKAH